ncbi:MAG: VWA domain-containing protein, partial [Candidatus Omnitrophica bacterium]|nr:VWA domain-containing protein [Candidatus Omnitrophota bacterium]
ERQLTVMILLDASSSSYFGTAKRFKSELAAEVSAVLAFAAIQNNDRVGLVIFTDRIEKVIPPRKGLQHVLRVVREALYFKPKGKGTDIAGALRYLDGIMTRRAVVFIISDLFAKDFKKPLSIANKKHDIVAITITDPRELGLPNVGLVELTDAEKGSIFLIDTSSAKLRERYAANSREVIEGRRALFGSISVDHIDITTDKPYVEELIKFFKMRKRRI